MAGGEIAGARELDQTPTWAVAAVVAIIILISIIIEKVLHRTGEWFQEKHNPALYEALEKIKGELMLLGFISLTLTFSQNYVAGICISLRYANTMLPCPLKHHAPPPPAAAAAEEHRRRLLWYDRRFLGGGGGSKGCKEGHVPLISKNGLHQLHIFIFFLAAFHVSNSAITMLLGRLKIRAWKEWERESSREHEAMNDPSRFRLTHETSFVRDYTSSWMKTPVSFYLGCFCRQFLTSVRKADYLTMRHGFINAHLAPGSKFNFQKYIKRSLEDDFKVVVGISPLLWASVVLFLLFDVHGWQAMFWVSTLPLVVILAVGTKLQAVIAQMALEIQERHAVVQGIPLVHVSDSNFWFAWPELVLYLIHFVLFENAFEITYFFWIWYEFGLKSCFHANFDIIILRVAVGVGAQFLCSYITLPLYALVTQMGSTMKRSIFDELTSKALMQWHMKAKKKQEEATIKKGSPGGSPGHSPSSHAFIRPHRRSNEFSDIELDKPQQSANIMATVDLSGNQRGASQDQGFQRDLLS